jgi:prepilin-type processing-associated H-X9-DG protein
MADRSYFMRIPDHAKCQLNLVLGTKCHRALGALHNESMNMLFIDGSVRTVAPVIDGMLFEAMATIAGSEAMGDYNP